MSIPPACRPDQPTMDWLSRQLWAAPPQSARPYYLTERVLACVYGEPAAAGWLALGEHCCVRWEVADAHAALCSCAAAPLPSSRPLPPLPTDRCGPARPPAAEEDRESWNKSYRQTFLSDRCQKLTAGACVAGACGCLHD